MGLELIDLEEAASRPSVSAQQMAQDIPVIPSAHPASDSQRESVLAQLQFGKAYTDHMAVGAWSRDTGWHGFEVRAYEAFTMNPATSVLHYAQEVFEGIKAYRHADGAIYTFRPSYNAARLHNSSLRMALPPLPEGMFEASLAALVKADAQWVPSEPGSSLYLRPFTVATEPYIGVHPTASAEYRVIASPVGPYFSGSAQIWVTDEFHRAGPGGTGEAKTGGNYAASLLPQLEASERGFDQVCFLDSSYTYLEELGGMNVFVVYADGSVATPALTGTILQGGTRSSLIRILRDHGREVREENICLAQLVDDIQTGKVVEMFACGTAAVVAPIGRLAGRDFDCTLEPGETTAFCYDTLTGIQQGRLPDPYGWLWRLV